MLQGIPASLYVFHVTFTDIMIWVSQFVKKKKCHKEYLSSLYHQHVVVLQKIVIVNVDAIVIVGKFIKTKGESTLSRIFEMVDDFKIDNINLDWFKY